MTESAHQPTAPAPAARSPRSAGHFAPHGARRPALHTELHTLRGALRALWEDLFSGAFAFRPLPPIPLPDSVTRALPARLRPYTGRLPHAGIVVAALLLAVYALNGFHLNDSEGGLLTAPAVALPVLLVLVRPVAAWWVSTASWMALAAVDLGATWPWTSLSFASHLLVMTLVTARTGLRTAVWMWAITAGLSQAYEAGAGWHDLNTLEMTTVSLVALLGVGLARGLYDSRHQIVEQAAVTAQERSRRTVLEERTTIARELHDVVAHHMSVVAIQAEAAPYRVENPPPELTQAFATIRENAVAALTELRRVLGVVRAADYQAPDAPQPTLAELDTLLDNVREAGPAVEKLVTGAVRDLPQGVELSAYRIVQEALSNALRHAPGADIRVEVSYVLGGLGLRVVNGPPRGPVTASPGAGHGITGMRERVAMLDGGMTTGPTADGGWETSVFLPVRPDPALSGEEEA
ncbi:sensor histidine kinase [Streptomyces sp. URMC 129]|uniref:sensor histidine kinase n=1 Tax=Streptomyces sp. URMC 129 TaxID=3423407 RepID=UPI003F1C14A8